MIRAWLRKWLGVSDPVAAPEKTEGLKVPAGVLEMFGASDGAELVRYAGDNVMVARKIGPPLLPPGVVPTDPKERDGMLALDSADMAPFWNYANLTASGLGFPGYPYLAELTQRSEYRAPAETIAQEMTREWVQLKTKGKTGDNEDDSDGMQADDAAPDPDQLAQMDDDGGPTVAGADDKIEDLYAALEKFGVRESFARLAELDSFFGRAQLYIDIDPGSKPPDEYRKLPLVIDPATIKKGSLRGLRVIEPIWTTPYFYNASDPTAEDFYKPQAWFVLGKRTHASRLLTFIAREVPDLLKPAYNFGGISMSQLMEPYVFQWLRTRNSVSDLIRNFSIISLATDLGQLLAGDIGAAAPVMTRAKLFTQNRDNQGLMLVDKDREELQQIAVPLSGLDQLQAQAQEHMAAPSHIPLVKLLGVSPAGLNATAEPEIKVFYDFVRSLQQRFFGKHFQTVLEVLQLDLFGTIDDAITFEWVPLSSPTTKELSEIRKADADSGVAYVTAGVISPDEERARLIADPNSGYTMLTGEAPEPPPTPGIDPETGEPVAGGPFAPPPDASEEPPKKDE